MSKFNPNDSLFKPSTTKLVNEPMIRHEENSDQKGPVMFTSTKQTTAIGPYEDTPKQEKYLVLSR